jgi:ABC-2 type transport system ATP-binding protein
LTISASAAAKKVFQICDKSRIVEPAIRITDLRFGYDGREVLHGLTFDVQPGEVTGLLGPNGAGKSTTLKIITGILKFAEGNVEVERCKLPAEAFEVKKRIGYVPESAELYESISALEFLELCGRLHELEEGVLRLRIDALLEGFGLSAQRRQRLGSYSKGMRQKILIAAALLHDPSVIVMDEPLTGLDVESAIMTKDLLASMASAGKAVLYSSHVLDVVERFCDRVLIMDRGNVVADDSPEGLKTKRHESSLEAVFRNITHAASDAPDIAKIMGALRTS